MDFQTALDKAIEDGAAIQLPSVTPLIFITSGVRLSPEITRQLTGFDESLHLAPMWVTIKDKKITPYTIPTEALLSLGWKVINHAREDDPLMTGERLGEVAISPESLEDLSYAVERIGQGAILSVIDTKDTAVKVVRIRGDFLPPIDKDSDIPRYRLEVDELANTVEAFPI